MTGRFADKVAIVTAAGSGIGAATATHLANEGAVVRWGNDPNRAAEYAPIHAVTLKRRHF